MRRPPTEVPSGQGFPSSSQSTCRSACGPPSRLSGRPTLGAGGLRGASPPAPESRVPAIVTKDHPSPGLLRGFSGPSDPCSLARRCSTRFPQRSQRTTSAIAVRASKTRQCPSHRASSASCRIPGLPEAGWACSAAWSLPTGGSAPSPGLTAGHISERLDVHLTPHAFRCRGSRANPSGPVPIHRSSGPSPSRPCGRHRIRLCATCRHGLGTAHATRECGDSAARGRSRPRRGLAGSSAPTRERTPRSSERAGP